MGKKLLIIAILTTFLLLMVPNMSAIQTQAINSEVIELTSETKNKYEKILDFFQQIPDQTKSDEITMQTLSDYKEGILSFIKNTPKGDIPDEIWELIKLVLRVIVFFLTVVNLLLRIPNGIKGAIFGFAQKVLQGIEKIGEGFLILRLIVWLAVQLNKIVQIILDFAPLIRIVNFLEDIIEELERIITDEDPTF